MIFAHGKYSGTAPVTNPAWPGQQGGSDFSEVRRLNGVPPTSVTDVLIAGSSSPITKEEGSTQTVSWTSSGHTTNPILKHTQSYTTNNGGTWSTPS